MHHQQNKPTSQRFRSEFARRVVGVQERSGICEFVRIPQSISEILDVNSAHYDPKTRSMRGDPQPDTDPNDKFYGVSTYNYKNSGQALEFKRLNIHAWEAFEKGQEIHMQAAPSQAESLFKIYKINREKLKNQIKDTILEKYAAANFLGQSEIEVEDMEAWRMKRLRRDYRR
ncbi:hypothetical protein TIFTF001_010263 [Ficus carica]|uniref:Pre-mRNA-splicing factor SLU7 n=1 Tax=Ficus carica TaxID=3494 RepID=A0AA88D4C9_FICCA|nr:hypothetical protein TIFTF001_010263 [Ficus carica]